MASDSYRFGAFLDSLPMNRRHWTIFGVCAAGFVFDALDFQIMALAAPTIAKEWGVAPTAMGFVLSATVVGMLVGSFLFGTISDRIGRRLGFQITIGLFAMFCGLSAFAQNIEQLAILRFLTGVGLGGLVPVDTAIMSEFMPRARRGRLMALWALFFPVGGLIAAMAARLIVPDMGWRSLFLVGISPAILVFLVRRLIPESPRFLLGRGRFAEARTAIEWLNMGPLPANLARVSETAAKEQRAKAESGAARMTVGTLFSPEYRKRTIMLSLLWFGWSFSYFGILLWLPSLLVQHRGMAQTDVFAFVIGFMVSGIIGRIAVSFLIDRLGRRYTIALFGLCASVAALAFGMQTDHLNLYIVGYIFAFFHDGGLSAIAPYTPELYPTHARATGVGCANGSGRVASILCPIVVGYLVPFGLSPIFWMFAAGYFLAAVVVLAFGIETAGMVLEAASLEKTGSSPQAETTNQNTETLNAAIN